MSEKKYDVPVAADPKSMTDQFVALVEVVSILRKACPWDSVQTNESIAHLLIEEAYETLSAIEEKDDPGFASELGDLLLHIIMHAIMAEERGAFNLIDVMVKIQEKLVHRHPHVFGEASVTGSAEVLQNWEALKMSEGRKSILDGVPKTLPALLRAQRIQHKAANVGFDWDNRTDVWDKIEEEFRELRHEIEVKNNEKAAEELGDFIFSIVNASRFEDLVAEESLQKTNNKFTRRFQYIEAKALEMNRNLKNMTLEEMDDIWNEAKINEL